MSKKIYTKEDWNKFRNEILDLVILYNHVKEYSLLSEKHIQSIKSFYFFSRQNTVKAFYIQLGLILSNGSPTLKNFVCKEEYSSLYDLYERKLKVIRDKRISHNLKTKIKQQEPLTQEDVDVVFDKVIEVSKHVDEKFNDPFHYDFVANSDGIKSIIPLIENNIKLKELENQLIENGFNSRVELGILDGKIRLIK